MHRRLSGLRFVGAILTVVLFGSCTSAPAEEDGSGEPDPLRVVTSYEVQSLNPLEQGFWAVEWGYGELLMRATENGTVEPWLLAKLERSSERSWRLTLRRGITFHNGSPLDADALVELIETQLADNAAVAAALPDASVAAEGPRTVVLTTSMPTPNLPNLLADEALLCVFDVSAARDVSEDAALADAGVYTGAFKPSRLGPDGLSLERNESYWDGAVALPGVEIQFVADGNARIQAVRRGQADLAFYPPTDALRTLRTDEAELRQSKVATAQLRGFLNLDAAPLDDVAVRKALLLGIDYREIAEDVLDGIYEAPSAMYPEVVPYAVVTIATDPDAAADQLDRAGWVEGADGVRTKNGQRLAITVLSYSTQPDTEVIATAMQSQLNRIGFEVRVENVPANYAAMEEPAGWHVGLSFDSALGYTFDPIDPLRTFEHSAGEYNFGGIADPELDGLIDQVGRSFDDRTRDEALERIQRIVTEEQAYMAFITQRPVLVVAGGDYRDYQPSSVVLHIDADTAPRG